MKVKLSAEARTVCEASTSVCVPPSATATIINEDRDALQCLHAQNSFLGLCGSFCHLHSLWLHGGFNTLHGVMCLLIMAALSVSITAVKSKPELKTKFALQCWHLNMRPTRAWDRGDVCSRRCVSQTHDSQLLIRTDSAFQSNTVTAHTYYLLCNLHFALTERRCFWLTSFVLLFVFSLTSERLPWWFYCRNLNR